MVGRNKLAAVWLGAGKGRRLMTFSNCCPCCYVWRVLAQVTPRIGDKVTGMLGVAVTVTDRCQAVASVPMACASSMPSAWTAIGPLSPLPAGAAASAWAPVLREP